MASAFELLVARYWGGQTRLRIVWKSSSCVTASDCHATLPKIISRAMRVIERGWSRRRNAQPFMKGCIGRLQWKGLRPSIQPRALQSSPLVPKQARRQGLQDRAHNPCRLCSKARVFSADHIEVTGTESAAAACDQMFEDLAQFAVGRRHGWG
jgi:hypothetical protein